MYRHLIDLLNDLEQQAGKTENILNHTHHRKLVNLSAIEKDLFAKTCVDWDWNVGSVIVLRCLQQSNILNMSEYIVSVNNINSENAQLVFNDLLETEFVLLADLLKHLNNINPISIQISDILHEGFKRLCIDLIENPNELTKNYFNELKEFVPDEYMTNLKFLQFTTFMEDSMKNSVEQAIQAQKIWFAEISDRTTILKSLCFSIVADYRNRYKILNHLFEIVKSNKFQCWKIYLMFLQCIIETGVNSTEGNQNREEVNALKKTCKTFLKETFQTFLQTRNKNILMIVTLIARQICLTNERIIGMYADWYKATIGEMKYYLKNDEFIFTMEILIELVDMESDEEILEIHINTYIPAPAHCNEIVLNYKQLCRSKLMCSRSKLVKKSSLPSETEGVNLNFNV